MGCLGCRARIHQSTGGRTRYPGSGVRWRSGGLGETVYLITFGMNAATLCGSHAALTGGLAMEYVIVYGAKFALQGGV